MLLRDPLYNAAGDVRERVQYQALMTRHNLNSHISWLLSHQVTPLVGVPTKGSSNSTAANQTILPDTEDGIEQEQYTRIPAPVPTRQLLPTVNADQDFLRPTLPAIRDARSAQGEVLENFSQGSMGRLSSAARSTRPALISQQHQLATPASTTGSLTQNYATFLRANNGRCSP